MFELGLEAQCARGEQGLVRRAADRNLKRRQLRRRRETTAYQNHRDDGSNCAGAKVRRHGRR